MKKIQTSFATNFGGKTHRRQMLEGRPHLVVDVAMIPHDGIMNGSEGAYLYPREENLKSVNDWNHVPIMNWHPEKNGTFCTGRTPEFINSRKLGVMLQATPGDSQAMRSEAWFDEERTKEINPEIYDNIINNRPMEGSTGLTFEVDEISGIKDGTKYIGIARNYKPDHYAVLINQKGAFPVAKGGGFFANTSGEILEAITTYNREWTTADRETHPLSDFGEPGKRGFPVEDQEDLEHAAELLHHAADPSTVKRRLIRIAKRKGLKLPESWGPGATTNAAPKLEVEGSPASTIEEVSSEGMSHDEKKGRAHEALKKKYGERGSYWNGWIEDMYPEHLVYNDGGDLHSEKYSDDGKEVKLAGSRKKVERRMMYKDSSNQEGGPVPLVNKVSFVNNMIANGGYPETERAALESMSETTLKSMPEKFTANSPPPSPPPVPADLEASLKTFHPTIANQIRRGLAMEAAEKGRCVEAILANEENIFTKEFLEAKPLEELQGLVAMVGVHVTSNVAGGQSPMFLPGRGPVPMYNGTVGSYSGPATLPIYGTPGVVGNTASDPKEGPKIPDLTFDRETHAKNRA